MRPSGRKPDELRVISMETNVNKHAEGSCLIKMGETHVLCLASVEERVPPWMRNSGKGWVTAEYGMLPRATYSRTNREATRGKQTGRTQEIQRLIGRSLRAVTDLKAMGEIQVRVDCDVLQADGGTRTAAITGSYVALYQAFEKVVKTKLVKAIPLIGNVAAISCGIFEENCVLDLDYAEDSAAETDANFILASNGKLIEIQCTAETEPFSREALTTMLDLADKGVGKLFSLQHQALGLE